MIKKSRFLSIISIFIILIINIGAVFADTPTPYPTVTPDYTAEPGYQPDVADDLPEIGDNFNCPVGGVEGYGSCTPAPLWNMKCGHCTGGYPTATPVMTPTPSGIFDNSDLLVWSGEVEFVENESEELVANARVYVQSELSLDYNFNAQLDLDLQHYASGLGGFNNDVYITISNNFAVEIIVEFMEGIFEGEEPVLLEQGETLNKLIESFPGDTDWELEDHQVIYIEVYDNLGTTFNQVNFGYTASNMTLFGGGQSGHVDILYYGGYYIPGGYSSGDSYCNSIVCIGETGYEDFGFSHSGLSFGNIYCLDIGPVIYEIFGFGINIPWIAHICFQQIGLGDVLMLGVSLSLDIVLLTMTMAWFINIVFIA